MASEPTLRERREKLARELVNEFDVSPRETEDCFAAAIRTEQGIAMVALLEELGFTLHGGNWLRVIKKGGALAVTAPAFAKLLDG